MDPIDVLPLAIAPDGYSPASSFGPFFPVGCLVAYAKTYGGGRLQDRFSFGRVTPTGESGLALDVQRPSVVLLPSYVWNFAAVLRAARRVKEQSPESIVIVGGPQIPRAAAGCERLMREHSYIDVAVRGEGEVTLAEILETIARPGGAEQMLHNDYSLVQGLTYRDRSGALVRTADRARVQDLEAFPSPYTTGEYDHWLDGLGWMPMETNRGCPYGCAFCDWGAATLAKIHLMSLDRVFAEIEYAAARHVFTLACCDANFGMLPRDLDIARHMVEVSRRCGYPKQVAYANAKVAKPRVMEIVKLLWDAGLIVAGQISMQTTDEKVLQIAQRSNIKTSEYEKIIAFYHANDIPATSDMMVGLPGQSFDVCQRDLQFLFDHKVMALVFATTVMPNAPMADPEYLKRYEIDVDAAGHVKSSLSFDAKEYARMFQLFIAYKLFIKLGVARYLLYFMQVERGVPAMTLVAEWLRASEHEPERYPRSHYVKTKLLDRDYQRIAKDWLILHWSHEEGHELFGRLDEFYGELLSLYADRFGVSVSGTDLDAVLAAQAAVMPSLQPPASLELLHDVASYFTVLRRMSSIADPPPDLRPLRDYPAGRLEFSAPPAATLGFADVDGTAGRLERASNLKV